MRQAPASNKRRRTSLIDNNFTHIIIYATLLTVKYSNEAYARLKKENETTSSGIIRKRCRALMTKMSEPTLSSGRIAAIAGCSRNFVDSLIHSYNNKGIDSVLETAPVPGRPGRLKSHMEEISKSLESRVPRSAAEAAHIIRDISGILFSLTWTRENMHRCGFRFIKTQPIPGRACPQKQTEWISALQPVIDEAKECKRKLYFMDAVHFTLEAFTCHVWCKGPLYLKTGAGRNRFNLIGCVDPFSLDIIQSHSMVYVDAEQTKSFLEKVRLESGDIPVSIVLDNARYQHCQAVKDKAAELGINLIFLPPYSPNLNIIERLWKYTRRHVLAGKYFDSPVKFHEALRHFFEVDFINHKQNLSSLLTLKFQSFEDAHLLCA